MICTFPDGRKGTQCVTCGYALRKDYTELPVRGCGPPQFPGRGDDTLEFLKTNPLPLGDYTESLLAKFGVTKERYKEAKQKFGMAPECECDGRKLTLNEWGQAVSDWWRAARGLT